MPPRDTLSRRLDKARLTVGCTMEERNFLRRNAGSTKLWHDSSTKLSHGGHATPKITLQSTFVFLGSTWFLQSWGLLLVERRSFVGSIKTPRLQKAPRLHMHFAYVILGSGSSFQPLKRVRRGPFTSTRKSFTTSEVSYIRYEFEAGESFVTLYMSLVDLVRLSRALPMGFITGVACQDNRCEPIHAYQDNT